MAADRNTPEGVENWLIQSSTNPWSFPSIVGPELTREILQHICSRWSSYPSNIKLGVLFALLCIRKHSLSTMVNELSAIITNGSNDNDEWVRLVSKMLQNYPSTGALDLNIEQHIPQDAQLGLQNLMERIQQTGIKFHPMEYAFIDRDISDAFSTNNTEASMHFSLKQGFEVQSQQQQRLHALKNVAVPPPSPGLTSPVNATGFNFTDQNRPQGLSTNRTPISSGPSLFIPGKRRPSQQSFYRPPNPQKLVTTVPRGGPTQGPDLPSEPKITQGKKYVKPTKIQILDITTATTITRNQEETKLKTQMEEQQTKEKKRQEREKQKEEKRREEEEKKKQKERGKAEKARLKEEAKQAREKEKRERAAAKAAAATPSNEIGDIQSTNVTATRKKKKINYDETIEEEIVSDEELSRKNPKKPVTSPTASLSPHQLDSQFSTSNQNTAMISQNGSSSNSTDTVVTQPALMEPMSSVSEQPVATDPELPKSQFEEIPRNEMSEALRKQFEMNCGAVLDKSNKIHGDNRQLIINFLGGHHTKPEQREKLMGISNGVSCNEDEIRHIILHEEKTPIPNEGKEIQETFIFEMNLSNGQWRKLKRKKIKAVKNPNLEALNGRTNGKFYE